MGQTMMSQQQPFIGPPVRAKTYSRHNRRSNKAKRLVEKGTVDEFYHSDEQQHAQTEVLSSNVTTLQKNLVGSVKSVH